MKLALVLVGLAALGGGAYYLIKAGKLVAEPTFGEGTPVSASVPVVKMKAPVNMDQLRATITMARSVPVMFD
jgi:hypothetical protein